MFSDEVCIFTPSDSVHFVNLFCAISFSTDIREISVFRYSGHCAISFTTNCIQHSINKIECRVLYRCNYTSESKTRVESDPMRQCFFMFLWAMLEGYKKTFMPSVFFTIMEKFRLSCSE